MIHGVDAESLKSLDGPHDVEHGVYCSDLMQVHLFGCNAVNLAFGFTEEPERANRALLHPVGNRRTLHEPDQLADVATVWLLGDRELDLLAPHARASHVSNRDADVG